MQSAWNARLTAAINLALNDNTRRGRIRRVSCCWPTPGRRRGSTISSLPGRRSAPTKSFRQSKRAKLLWVTEPAGGGSGGRRFGGQHREEV